MQKHLYFDLRKLKDVISFNFQLDKPCNRNVIIFKHKVLNAYCMKINSNRAFYSDK